MKILKNKDYDLMCDRIENLEKHIISNIEKIKESKKAIEILTFHNEEILNENRLLADRVEELIKESKRLKTLLTKNNIKYKKEKNNMDINMLKFIEIMKSYNRPQIGELSINEKALFEYEKFCFELIEQIKNQEEARDKAIEILNNPWGFESGNKEKDELEYNKKREVINILKGC